MSALLFLQQHLAGHQQLLVAYSGGLDSSVLLHQLVLLRQQSPLLRLRAIHIHHGLSASADAWVNHCQSECLRWDVPLEVVRVTVDGRKSGIEAAARQARYTAFRHALLPGESLVTAQHQDDQCETLLLALKRGSGPAGLSAMPRNRALDGRAHLRPLLDRTRHQLEAWAQAHQLRWIEDESNQDSRYDRNFLRQEILPALTSRWPHFSQAVARSASLCAEQEQLLDELLSASLSALVDEKGALDIVPLQAMSEVHRAALLRRWIAGQQGRMPSKEALNRIWSEVACSREDAAPRLRLGQAEVRRFRQRLYWLTLAPDLKKEVIPWPAPWTPLLLPAGLGKLVRGERGMAMRPPGDREAVSVRFQASGQYHITGRAGSRPLKKLWQELGIPPWQRERTPLIYYNDSLMAAAGLFVTREGEPAGDRAWHIHWEREES
ncbi:tRNA lysidine(34) synthetase TilS [Pantoea sp. FN060301]|uniref:tRNA lysidine(34) synthetase TilS n=1 Tax=Pantoea sp. FN060301 TaxID=3420380 RepID=UPI003D16D596